MLHRATIRGFFRAFCYRFSKSDMLSANALTSFFPDGAPYVSDPCFDDVRRDSCYAHAQYTEVAENESRYTDCMRGIYTVRDTVEIAELTPKSAHCVSWQTVW